jgi:hypothetical protein
MTSQPSMITSGPSRATSWIACATSGEQSCFQAQACIQGWTVTLGIISEKLF